MHPFSIPFNKNFEQLNAYYKIKFYNTKKRNTPLLFL